MRKRTRRLGVTLGVLLLLSGLGAAVTVPHAQAAGTPSSDCDDGVNVIDGTVSGTYTKVKLKMPSPGVLWVCFRVDRNADPAVHEGGKLKLGTTSAVVDDDWGYCDGRPGTTTTVDGTFGPDETPVLVQRMVPTGPGEAGLCVRVGSTVALRVSGSVPPTSEHGLESDTKA